MRNWFIAIAISLALGVEAAPPARTEIAYEIKRGDAAIAEVVAKIEHDGKTYRIDETWGGKGVYAMRGKTRRASNGRISEAGLQPLAFIDERGGRNPSRIAFDWDARVVTLQHKGKIHRQAMPTSPADRLTLLYGNGFTPLAEATAYDVASGLGIATHVYRRASRERIETPAGAFAAVKLVKDRDTPGGRATEIWLAERLGYLPVRIVIVDQDGTRIDQVAIRVATP